MTPDSCAHERDRQQMIYALNTTVLHDVVEHLLALAGPRPTTVAYLPDETTE